MLSQHLLSFERLGLLLGLGIVLRVIIASLLSPTDAVVRLLVPIRVGGVLAGTFLHATGSKCKDRSLDEEFSQRPHLLLALLVSADTVADDCAGRRHSDGGSIEADSSCKNISNLRTLLLNISPNAMV